MHMVLLVIYIGNKVENSYCLTCIKSDVMKLQLKYIII